MRHSSRDGLQDKIMVLREAPERGVLAIGYHTRYRDGQWVRDFNMGTELPPEVIDV